MGESLDIAMFTETHFLKGDDLHVPGYRTYQVTRKKHKDASRGSGGVAVLVKRKFSKGVQSIACPGSSMVWVRLTAAFLAFGETLLLALFMKVHNSLPLRLGKTEIHTRCFRNKLIEWARMLISFYWVM